MPSFLSFASFNKAYPGAIRSSAESGCSIIVRAHLIFKASAPILRSCIWLHPPPTLLCLTNSSTLQHMLSFSSVGPLALPLIRWVSISVPNGDNLSATNVLKQTNQPYPYIVPGCPSLVYGITVRTFDTASHLPNNLIRLKIHDHVSRTIHNADGYYCLKMEPERSSTTPLVKNEVSGSFINVPLAAIFGRKSYNFMQFEF